MNIKRRKRIALAADTIEIEIDLLREILDQEQEAYDNLPEGLQASSRGEAIQEIIDRLEQAIDSFDSAIDELRNLEE